MAKYIPLTVRQIYQKDLDTTQGIPVDGIIKGAVNAETGYVELLVQFEFKAEPYRIEVEESLQDIIDAATAAGYLENGLTILPITKINQTTFSPAVDHLLNLQSFYSHTLSPILDANGVAIGTTIQYSKEHEKKPIRLETSDVLIPAPTPY